MDRIEIGKARINEILGPSSAQIIDTLGSISKDFASYIIEFAYGDIYARPGLTDKSREIAAVSCLIGQGNTGLPLKSHLRGMLNVGCSRKDIIEVLLFLIPYIGFPVIVDSMITADQVFKEIDADQKKAS